MRTLKTVLITCLAAALVATSAPSSWASATGPAASVVPRSVPAVPTVVGICTAHHRGFDRVVWQFPGDLPSYRRARFVSGVSQDGSGYRLCLAGRSKVLMTFSSASAHDESTGRATAPRRKVAGLPNVIEVAQAGDLEAVVT